MKIKGKRIDLVMPTMRHVDDICSNINDKRVAKYLAVVPHPYNLKDGIFFIKDIVNKGWNAKTDYPFAIYEKEKKEVIGVIGLHKIDKKNQRAEVGYWLGRRHWRQGYGSEALRLMLKFGFKNLKLNKIWAGVYHPNKPSVLMLKKMGFKKDGVLRKHTFKNNTFYDDIMMSMLREEYEREK
ncbi:GNAT family N-acetyltransferase [archaeon]|nr:GNAT family N-acetyltransferase [archaeon]